MNDQQGVRVEGPRVMLRELHPGDLEAIHAYARLPAVSRHTHWDTHPDLTVTTAILNSWLAETWASPRTVFNLAVDLNDSLVGVVRLAVISAAHRRGEFGYALHPDTWGQGLGTETARLLVGFGFGTLGLHRMEACCHPYNHGSRRVLEKTGLRYEGRIRDHMLVGGTWRDSLSYAILSTDQPAGNVPALV
ncbi:N-acetyltransferase [Longispora fulva]|uniref:RimJ/RimL family protein N-acetyltransferase n=1 Tax=Longispora fulva TaxID=619741 RepID=A0A8J7GH40_9ACTN|nr:GNAT family protein [Longispora fulva]MBG6136582.1 RimJ/RimL family protein N-acetyltransferase [Longispora fulva]GIG59751.1 N-acetyltransferase [Longispora fulva]